MKAEDACVGVGGCPARQVCPREMLFRKKALATRSSNTLRSEMTHPCPEPAA